MENETDFYCAEVLSEKTKVQKILETENVLAYYHTRPFYETHLVVIPKRHIASLLTLEKADEALFLEMLAVIKTIADRVVAEKGAARVLTNLGKYQESKHLHFHVVSGAQIRPDNKV
ncbi:MAG TPA: HIT domain-containing protein [Pyrinomonadaceae bacterium]|jgi:histidine triad (HIT) family protein